MIKVRTRFCQKVSHRAQIERIIFSNLCLKIYTLQLKNDECTVAIDKNGRTQWFRKCPGETRLEFKGKFKHAHAVHIIGGILRRGKTKLIIFRRNLNAEFLKELFSVFCE